MPHSGADVVVAPRAVLADIFAQRCAERASNTIATRGVFALVVPGGSAARAFLPALAAAPIDWTRTAFFWADERGVPVDHPESNFGLARELLRDTDTGRLARMYRMEGDAADLSRAAADYASTLGTELGRPPGADVVLLGVGEDGHVASLFPAGKAIAERRRWVVAVDDAPAPPVRRLTITLPVVPAASVVCLAAFGAAKAQAVGSALDDRGTNSPVAQVLRGAREAWVLLDDEAASGLSPR